MHYPYSGLISRNIFSMKSKFLFFPHCAFVSWFLVLIMPNYLQLGTYSWACVNCCCRRLKYHIGYYHLFVYNFFSLHNNLHIALFFKGPQQYKTPMSTFLLWLFHFHIFCDSLQKINSCGWIGLLTYLLSI